MSKVSSNNKISELFGKSTKNKSLSRSSSLESKPKVNSSTTPKHLPGMYGVDLSKTSSQRTPKVAEGAKQKNESKASYSSLFNYNNSTGSSQSSFNMNGFLGIMNKSEAAQSQNIHLVLKKNQEKYAKFKANLQNNKEDTTIPRDQLHSTYEEFDNKVFEYQHSITDAPKEENFKYGPYATLVSMYEAEKTLRKNFEDLHRQALDELNEIKKTKDDSLGSLLRSEFDDLNRKNEIENLKNEIVLMREREERALNDKFETENIIKSQIKLLKEKEEKLKSEIKLLKEKEEKSLKIEKDCIYCKAHISEIHKLRLDLETSKKNNEIFEKSEITSFNPSMLESTCKNCDLLKQQMNDCSLEYSLKLKQLETQNSLDRKEFEAKFITLVETLDEIKDSQNQQECSVCEELKLETASLKNLVSSLKSKNSEINSQLKQKLRESDHFECHTLLKRTATKISADILLSMNKDQLLENFKFLKKEYEEMSQKLLSQADELFEKNVELVQLRKQKTQFYNELMNLKSQLGEMYELREHAGYLLNLIGGMQEKIKIVGESYRDCAQSAKGTEENDEYKSTLNMISDIIKLNISKFSDRRGVTYNWNIKKGREHLIQYLKYSILGYIKNDSCIF